MINISFMDFTNITQWILLILSLIIGIYVYKDAKSLGKRAVLWALVAAFLPLYIGLLIYLIHSDKKMKCPNCGTVFLTPAKADDNLNTKRKRKIAGIIIATVIISIISQTFIFAPFFTPEIPCGTAFSLNSENVSTDVVDWMKQCDAKGEGVYVLKLSTEKIEQLVLTSENGEIPEDIYCYYIYINQFKDKDSKTGFIGNAMVKGNTLEILYSFNNISNSNLLGYELSEITAIDCKINKLVITIDDVKVEYSIDDLI